MADQNTNLENSRIFWDNAATTFDNEPDHGLRQPAIRQAWMTLLQTTLLPSLTTVLDIGCGTGSLSLVLTDLGHTVTGVDFSPEMIARATEKATHATSPIQFRVMDASQPDFPAQHFDAIVCRHLLWALPQPEDALQRWVELLKPQGRLILIEGF